MLFNIALYFTIVYLVSSRLLEQKQVKTLWEQYKKTEGKSYENNTEDDKRRTIFSNNLENIVEHNLEADMGLSHHKLGLNAFADMSHEDFLKKMTGLTPPDDSDRKSKSLKLFEADYGAQIPDSKDWRNDGIVTPIKNQEGCGACWSFAAVGSLESHHAQATGNLVALSDQNALDCAGPKYDNDGCRGGLPDNAFRWIIDNGGIDSEECYPYESQVGECRYRDSCTCAKMTSFVDIPRGDEQALAIALATKGPVAVGLDAGQPDFMLYKSGIFNPDECSQQVNHAVILIGYGTEDGMDYWLAKNSWGVTWGEDGYFKLARNAENKCGISNLASYPEI